MRKNDECNPRPVRDSDDKGSQNHSGRLRVSAGTWADFRAYRFCRIINSLFYVICEICKFWAYKIYDVLKKVDVLSIFFKKVRASLRQPHKSSDAVSQVHLAAIIHRGSFQNIIMNTLGQAKVLCSVVLMQQNHSSVVSSEQEKTVSLSDQLNNKDSALARKLSEPDLAQLNTPSSINNLADEISDEDEGLRLQMEIEGIMSKVDADGFTGDDKAILRSNIPIPERYGSYKPTQGELKKATPIIYVPEEDTFIIDEERSQARKAWDS